MCCCHKGENNGACNRSCKDCLLYVKCFLMQLSVALGLHFGWGSQLNTSEMFWIAVRSQSCQLPFCNLFTSHSSFIVFWERDITSEHHVSRSISSLLFPRLFTFLHLPSVAIIIPCI